ncbi:MULTISPECIES: cytochrome P450 [Actinomadura]|uniref:Cytochrome P450 n=1 Tax=Actinomadura yumaensis TaxID=111807 RepID=A0ABW2CPI2_9ACTN|nr:cytochrome P450 [Actinomadura sp. J1-007]MWK36570.1 cytochrome P450 [Actinomadura sp. J1-007]
MTNPTAPPPASPQEPAAADPPAPRNEPAEPVRLCGARLAGDPGELHRSLRQRHGPVVPVLLDGDVPAWFVLGYREVGHVAGNPRLFARDCRRWNARELVPDDWPLMPHVGWTPSVTFAEGAEHRRRTGAIGDALDRVERSALTLVCERAADRLLRAFSGDGEADLVAQYAHRFPLHVLAELYGLPRGDIPVLAQDVAESLDADGKAARARERIRDRMARLVAERRAAPARDVPSRLVEHPAGLTDEEITLDLLAVTAAAHQRTGDWIGNALRLMLVDDRFSMSMQGGRGGVSQALNEALWEDAPARNLIGRWAVHDCDLGGRRVRRGDLLVLGLAAAGADPRVRPGSYTDHGPGANRAHLSFGHGEHGCPFPAPELAETMSRTAVEVLLDRLPDVALAVPPERLEWRPSASVRGLRALPAVFSPVIQDMTAWDDDF